MKLRRSVQALHRWLALALCVQILLWMGSGAVMSLLPIALVHGDPNKAYDAPVELRVHNYFPPAGVVSEVAGAQEVTLKSWLGREVYVVSSRDSKAMFDADTGETGCRRYRKTTRAASPSRISLAKARLKSLRGSIIRPMNIAGRGLSGARIFPTTTEPGSIFHRIQA